MLLLKSLVFLVFVQSIAAQNFFGNLTFGTGGATFSFLKKDAEEKFLRDNGYRNFKDFVDSEWFSIWDPTSKTLRRYPATPLHNSARDWWNQAHIYSPPGKKCPGRRCRRDTFRSVMFEQAQSRMKRQNCDNIPTPPVLRRREWRQLSQADRNSFIAAFNAMGANNVPGTSETEHNTFVQQHRITNAPSSHDGAAFLPWHREYLWRFANQLRRHNYVGDLPYWDSVVDIALPNPADSAVWTSANFGASLGLINVPWTNIEAISNCEIQNSGALRRNMKTSTDAHALMMDRDSVATILANEDFQELTKGWDPFFEESYERMLLLMGTPTTAQMANPNCAPTDPVFWLHAAFMDHIWERFRGSQNFVNREVEYPLRRLGSNRHRWNRNMSPFEGLINIHGLSNFYTSYYYSYSQAPSEIDCNNHNDCGGDMLWCRNNLCMAKIRVGGRCVANWPDIQCHCISGSPNCNSNLDCEC